MKTMNLTAVYLEINHVNYTIETETWGTTITGNNHRCPDLQSGWVKCLA